MGPQLQRDEDSYAKKLVTWPWQEHEKLYSSLKEFLKKYYCYYVYSSSVRSDFSKSNSF